jgi:hypothetical protein
MADEQQHPHSVQHHPPTAAEPEPREETIARAVREAGEAQRVDATVEGADPSTRSGLNRALMRTVMIAAGIGFVLGAVAALILSLTPGPFETRSWAGTIGYMIVLGAAIALVVGILSTLILLEREDGRVERDVERRTGKGPQGPGRPIDPKYDPKPH